MENDPLINQVPIYQSNPQDSVGANRKKAGASSQILLSLSLPDCSPHKHKDWPTVVQDTSHTTLGKRTDKDWPKLFPPTVH
jgi:hypothetical protein